MKFWLILSVGNISGVSNDREKIFKQICEKVDAVMEPFYYDPDNPDYLVFEDRTADIKKWHEQPENQNTSYEEFAEKKLYMDYSEELDAYGEYYNPNALYDYYSVGRRNVFLIRESCTEYFVDETVKDTRGAPDGYLWVCAARKKDIEWKKMNDFGIQIAKERYLAYVKYYNTGEVDEAFQELKESSRFVLCDKGIKNGWTYPAVENFFYYHGETMDEYLQRIGYLPESKYPVFATHFIQDGVYHCIDDIADVTELEQTRIWMKQVDDYISELPEESVLVAIDCHN